MFIIRRGRKQLHELDCNDEDLSTFDHSGSSRHDTQSDLSLQSVLVLGSAYLNGVFVAYEDCELG